MIQKEATHMRRLANARILMYSHDTFGLGHLRRCRTIAHALVEHYRGLSVLILSGSTIAGAFDYRVRSDFVKIPSVIKLRNGEYTSLDRHTDVNQTLKMRQSIIRHTAESFQPDMLIVDKEPLGLRGELEETLSFLKTRGTTLILGLRDVMDAPRLLKPEWAKRDVLKKMANFYDSIWVYGPKGFYDPLVDLDVSPSIKKRVEFVGFLHRDVPQGVTQTRATDGDYILITTGGGGDGAELVHNVLDAYRSDKELTQKAVIVLGPFMPAKQRQKLLKKSKQVPYAEVIEFDNRMEFLMNGAKAVVSMGGYNTFCEILSFDKPALIIPRTAPREEQLIRAKRAAELGLIDMLLPEQAENPEILACALKKLLKRPPPSQSAPGFVLDGLESIIELVGGWLEQRMPRRLAVVDGSN